MLVSYNLLKKYVELHKKVTPHEVAEKLTMATVEVEKVIDKVQELKNVIVGRVEKIEDHPNADKLKIAWVDIGDKNNLSKIVCGGTNLKEHMTVPVALPGAQVRWHGEGDLVKLSKTKIRGEESNGMICAANEIGLFDMFPHGEMEITNLNGLGLEVGQSLASALSLDDVVFDIDNKSLTNRPDLWSHYGIARELAAIFKVKLKEVSLNNEVRLERQAVNNQTVLDINVQVDKLCPRYIACLVKNVKIKESPRWLKEALAASGYKAINNIVDITNYVMSELGQPMHAFDAYKIRSVNEEKIKIEVRSAKKNEKIVVLDGTEYKLNEDNLVISTDSKAIALAGIIGGAESAINTKTQQVVLEAANFDALNIRQSSQQLGLRTDSSMRFEKGLHPKLAELAMRRALKLIQEIIPEAEISEPLLEHYQFLDNEQSTFIEVSQEFIMKRIGTRLGSREIKAILENLGFEVEILFSEKKGKDKLFKVTVPWWRATGDISIKEDIVEEVARIYGYDNLGLQTIKVELDVAKNQIESELESKIKNYLTMAAGMNEIFNYPWAQLAYLKKFSLKQDWLELAYPPAEEFKFLQNSLLPNLISNIEDNLRFFDKFRVFELARVYQKKNEVWSNQEGEKLPIQPKYLAAVLVDNKQAEVFLNLKGILEGMLELLDKTAYKLQAAKPELDVISHMAYLEIIWRGKKIGWLGELDYNQLGLDIKNSLNIKRKNKKVALFELNWDKLIGFYKKQLPHLKYKSLPQFPAVNRDIAIEVAWQVNWSEIKTTVERVNALIYQVNFLSEYPLKDKKSIALRVTYQADKTLRDKEVEQIEKEIIKKLKNKFGAKLRN